MEETLTSLAVAVGQRVRKERKARDLTLDDLAATSGVSRRLLVSLEQGETNPNLATLLRISDALGIGLPSLVEAPTQTEITVTRAGQAPVLWRGASGGTAELVAGTTAPNVLELWSWHLQPGDAHSSEAHIHGTWELLNVLEGELQLTMGERIVALSVGDSISFAGDQSHEYRNLGELACRFSLAVYEPLPNSQGAAGRSAKARTA